MSEQHILDAYTARQDRELDDFVQQQAAVLKSTPTATAAPMTPPGETPKPVAGGNIFSRAGSAIAQRYMEGRKDLTQGVEGAPDGSRGAVGRVWDVTKGLANMAGAPLAGVGSVVGEGVAAVADATGSMTDESLRSRLATIAKGGSDLDKGTAAQERTFLEGLLAMPYADRIKSAQETGAVAGEVAAGFLSPTAIVKGVSRAVGVGAKGAAAGAAPTAVKAGEAVADVAGAVTPSPNVARMGVEDSAKNLILNINAKLHAEGELARATRQTHEMTVEAAKSSRFRNVEEILSHDDALPLAAHDLTAARAVRDASLTHADDLVNRFLAGDVAVGDEMRAAILGTGQISKKVTNITTAGARTVESGNIVSDAALANRFNLENYGKQIALLSDELPASNEELAAAFSKLASVAEKEQLAARTANQPAAFWQVFYGLNLLSAPATHAANIGGNAVGMMTSLADRSFGSLAARPFRWAGAKGSHIAPGEAVEMARGWAEAIPDAFRAVKNAVTKGEAAFAAGKADEMAMHLAADVPSTAFNIAEDGNFFLKFFDVAATKVIRGLSLDTMGMYVGRGLQAGDNFFATLVHQGELRAQALRIAYDEGKRGADLAARQAALMLKPEGAMEQAALLASKAATFQKEFTSTIGKASQTLAGSTPARLTLTPFWRTPVRVAEFSMDHTPVLNEIASTLRGDFAAGGHRAEMALGRSMTSLAVTYASWELASNGMITGAGPTDPKLRAHMTAAGWQPFSVFNPTTGKYYSMAPLMAVLPVIGAVATIAEMAPELKDHEYGTLMQAATIGLARGALNHPFWSGVSEALDGITELSSRGTLEKIETFWQKRLVSATLPGGAALRTLVRATDGEQRDARPTAEDGELDALLKRYQANIPGWAAHLPARMNPITGEPVMRAESLYGLSPVAVTTQTSDHVLLEIAALGGAGLPAEVPRVILGTNPSNGPMEPSAKEGILLTESERARLTELQTKTQHSGKTLHQALAQTMASSGYKNAADIDKADALRTVYNAYEDAAIVQLRKERPELNQIAIQREQARMRQHIPERQR